MSKPPVIIAAYNGTQEKIPIKEGSHAAAMLLYVRGGSLLWRMQAMVYAKLANFEIAPSGTDHLYFAYHPYKILYNDAVDTLRGLVGLGFSVSLLCDSQSRHLSQVSSSAGVALKDVGRLSNHEGIIACVRQAYALLETLPVPDVQSSDATLAWDDVLSYGHAKQILEVSRGDQSNYDVGFFHQLGAVRVLFQAYLEVIRGNYANAPHPQNLLDLRSIGMDHDVFYQRLATMGGSYDITLVLDKFRREEHVEISEVNKVNDFLEYLLGW